MYILYSYRPIKLACRFDLLITKFISIWLLHGRLKQALPVQVSEQLYHVERKIF